MKGVEKKTLASPPCRAVAAIFVRVREHKRGTQPVSERKKKKCRRGKGRTPEPIYKASG